MLISIPNASLVLQTFFLLLLFLFCVLLSFLSSSLVFLFFVLVSLVLFSLSILLWIFVVFPLYV